MSNDLRAFCGLPPEEYFEDDDGWGIEENQDYCDISWAVGRELFDEAQSVEERLVSGAMRFETEADIDAVKSFEVFSNPFVEPLATSTVVALNSVGAIPFSAGDPLRCEPNGKPPEICFWLPENVLELVATAAVSSSVEIKGVEHERPCLCLIAQTFGHLRSFAATLMASAEAPGW